MPLHRLASGLRHPHTVPEVYRPSPASLISLSRSLPGRLFDDGSDVAGAASRDRGSSPPSTVNATRLDFGAGAGDGFGTMDDQEDE